MSLNDLLNSSSKHRTTFNPSPRISIIGSSINPKNKVVTFRGEAYGTSIYPVSIAFFNVSMSTSQSSQHKVPAKTKDGDEYFIEFLTVNKHHCQVRCNCFTGDTLIPLANGYSLPIKDLVDLDTFYVYSYDSSLNKVVIGRGHSCRVTRRDAKIVKVTLDNGTIIKCTPDHKFLTKNGKYVKAKNLATGESLMPLYREVLDSGWMAGYEVVLNNKQFTHHISDEYNEKYRTDCYYASCNNGQNFARKEFTDTERWDVRHHMDENKLNNSPLNIVRVTASDHRRIHDISPNAYFGSDDHIARMVNDNPMFDRDLVLQLHPNYARVIKFLETYQLNNIYITDKLVKHLGYHNKSNLRRVIRSLDNRNIVSFGEGDLHWSRRADTREGIYWKSDEHKARVSAIQQDLLKSGNHPFIKMPQISLLKELFDSIKPGDSVPINDEVLKYTRYSSYGCLYRGILRLLSRCNIGNVHVKDNTLVKDFNHKVLSVEDAGNEDVYDFTVDDYHNFAVDVDEGAPSSSGVFVHNCRDFYFTWQWWDRQNAALFGPSFPRYKRKTTWWPERNPGHFPGLCKHLIGFVEKLKSTGILR